MRQLASPLQVSDVLASAIRAYTYGKNKNLDIRNGLIMAFTVFTGAASHFAIGGMPDVGCLLFCVASTLLWARIAAKFANKASAVTLNRATGVVLAVLGAVILGVNYLK